MRVVALSCAVALTISASPPAGAQAPPRAGSPEQAARVVGMLAFAVWDRAGVPDIYSVRTDGSRLRRLTTGGGHEPAWSPDGSRIAFSWRDRVGVTSADGTSRSWVANGTAPTWAPDGRSLAYSCDEEQALCVLDLDSQRESVTVPRSTDWVHVGDPDWSPDGSSIVFTRTSAAGDSYSNHRQLFVVGPDGSDLRAVPRTSPLATAPAWSPDGSTLLYAERYDGRGGEYSGDLYSIRPDGTARTAVVKQPGRDDRPTWSPGGQSLGFQSDALGYPWMAGIWTASSDGRDRRLVVRGGVDPDWRPGFEAPATSPPAAAPSSGSRVAYVSATDAGFDLFTVRPDGSGVRRLTTHGRARDPAWSPDHTRIAYSTTRDAIRVLAVGTGVERRVARSYGVSGLTWSPSGRMLAWGGFEGITIVDLRTGSRRTVPTGPTCCARDPAWSPDGRVLAFSAERTTTQSDVMTVSPTGEDLRRVTRLRGEERQAEWSPDGRSIAFTHERGSWKAPDVDVLVMQRDGSGIRPVTTTNGLSFSPGWADDGRLAWYGDGPRPFGAAPRAGLWALDARGRPHLVVADRTIAYVAW